MYKGSRCSQGLFKDIQGTPHINFQGLNVNISSHHYTLRDISLTVKLHAIKLTPN